jgi:hypothetical protein
MLLEDVKFVEPFSESLPVHKFRSHLSPVAAVVNAMKMIEASKRSKERKQRAIIGNHDMLVKATYMYSIWDASMGSSYLKQIGWMCVLIWHYSDVSAALRCKLEDDHFEQFLSVCDIVMEICRSFRCKQPLALQFGTSGTSHTTPSKIPSSVTSRSHNTSDYQGSQRSTFSYHPGPQSSNLQNTSLGDQDNERGPSTNAIEYMETVRQESQSTDHSLASPQRMSRAGSIAGSALGMMKVAAESMRRTAKQAKSQVKGEPRS